MIKFKRYLIACLTAGTLLYGSACDKLLDLHPQTEYADANYWKSDAQATAALTGAYTRLQGVFARNFVYWGEGRTDNLDINLETNNSAIGVIRNNMDPGMPEADWGGFYQVIAQANLIIKNMPLLRDDFYATDTKSYNDICGQAYGLRALCYFYMVRLWGGVPLITTPVASASADLQQPRADTGAVYAQINADLDSAYTLLNATLTYSTPQETRARITRGAIDAIYTDFYMWRYNYDSALVSSQRVLSNANYTLAGLYDPNVDYLNNETLIDNTDYAKMFTIGFSNESIFEIDYNSAEGSFSSVYGLYGRLGQVYFKPNDALMAKFESNDLRPLQCFFSDGGIYKFFPKTGFDQTAKDENIILYRLADIMLLRAEALNQVGGSSNIDAAMSLLNRIRQRAGLAQYLPDDYNALTSEEREDLILDERQRELCFEGKRWYDLLRTGKAISTMHPINGLSDPENLLWPISLDVIRINPKVEQNSFYK